ncbi:hypothetical protein [Amycolatopsis sp. NPDC059021]|uniref:hypothetical protein n=1 Tax=Amycolatopsis sp. NPDC059021 TaxID=3346704 RepID=UPI00366C2320
MRVTVDGAALAVLGLVVWCVLCAQPVLAVVAGGVTVLAVATARTVRREPTWAVHDLGEEHRELVALIEATPAGSLLYDPVDDIGLICHHDSDSPERILTRITGSDVDAIHGDNRPWIMVERFRTEPGHPAVVAHRVEPHAVTLDDTGHIVGAAPMAEPPSRAEQRAAAEDMFINTAATFATAPDVRLVIRQLRRAQPLP